MAGTGASAGDDKQLDEAYVPSFDLMRNACKNALSTVFDEDTAMAYDFNEAQRQIGRICETVLTNCHKIGKKPFKYIVNCVLLKKAAPNGISGAHVGTSSFFGAQDGHHVEVYDAHDEFYAVVSLWWCQL